MPWRDPTVSGGAVEPAGLTGLEVRAAGRDQASNRHERAQSETPLLSIRGLAVSFGDAAGPLAVQDASMTVYPRQTVALVGESGSGKSVTALSVLRLLPEPPARIVAGQILLAAEHGAAAVDFARADMSELRRVRGAHVAMIFQEPMTSLNPVFTIGDQIIEAIRLHRPRGNRAHRGEERSLAAAAMSEVGITEPERRLGQYPHEFSGGMRQRAMIAMALACGPRVLLADEPTTALDVTIQAQILELLGRLKRDKGIGVVLITHDLGVVAGHADVVCVMYSGRVVECTDVFTLFARPLHPYTRGLLEAIPRVGLRRDRLVTVRDVVERDGEFTRLEHEVGLPLRAWWPGHRPPAGARCAPGPSGDSVLVQAFPGHWVRVWRSDAADAAGSMPDLAFRRQCAGALDLP